jgi:hypothetical protein
MIPVATREGARPGGALYPVLLLLGVLVFLGTMIPQVLVQASVGIRQDRGRDALILALESAIAFAEGRFKKDLTDALALTDTPTLRPFTIKPTLDNPDFGRKKAYDWEARLLRVARFDTVEKPPDPVITHVFSYRVQAKAWSTRPGGANAGSEVNGLLSVEVLSDKGKSGVTIRSIQRVGFESMNEDRPNLAFGPSPTPGP